MIAAYFDCPSGASGNMLLGAFLDAGARLTAVEHAIAALGLGGAAELRVDRYQKGKVEATHVEVATLQPQPRRRPSEIDRLISDAGLDDGVRERSRLAFRLLAEAEARAHGVDVSQVVLHEVGGLDALIDVVGTFCAAADLGVDAFYCSALPLSEGTVATDHGVMPLPAPATAEILNRVGAPTYLKDGGWEFVTPTGAAIIGACASFTSPRIDIEHEGFGAGTRDLPWPNVLHLLVGEMLGEATSTVEDEKPRDPALPAREGASLRGLSEETVAVIETNIDDMAPNLLAAVPQSLLDAGALDAFTTPVAMKKGRAGLMLTVICAPDLLDRLAAQILQNTSTLGVRVREERRLVAARRIVAMETEGGEIRVKLKELGGRVVAATPEFDDVSRIARARGMSLIDAQSMLSEEARRRFVEGER